MTSGRPCGRCSLGGRMGCHVSVSGAICTLAVITMLLMSTSASAQPPEEVSQDRCVEAHLANQKLKQQGKLAEARQELLVCVQDGCPAADSKGM